MASLQDQLQLMNPSPLSNLSDEELRRALASTRAAMAAPTASSSASPSLSPMERAFLLAANRNARGAPPSPLITAAQAGSSVDPLLLSALSSSSQPIGMEGLLALDLAAARRSLALAALSNSTNSASSSVSLSATIDRQKKIQEMKLLQLLEDQTKKSAAAPKPAPRPADYSAQIESMEEQMKAMQEVFSRHTSKKTAVVPAVNPKPQLTAVALPKISHGFKSGAYYGQPQPEEDDVTVTETTLGDDDEDIMPPPPNRRKAPESPRSSSKGFKKFNGLLSKGRRNSKNAMGAMMPKFSSSTKKAYISRIDDEIASMKEELRELEISGTSSLLMLSQAPAETRSSTEGEDGAKPGRTDKDAKHPSKGGRTRSKSPFGFGDRRKKPRNRSPDR